jgi:hypothetical protein
MVAVIVSSAIATAALPAIAQPSEEFPGPSGSRLEGHTRSDGTVVLTDAAFCSLLLGSIWPDQRLTSIDLLDKTKKQKEARAGAFQPGQDETSVARCAEVISAYRTAAPEDDTLLAWLRRSPVVPESLAGLLPDDYFADPMLQAAPVLDAARTSGYGSLVSAPFLMDAETWLVQVDAADCATWSGSLHNARDAAQVIAVQDNREYLYNVEPGHYYWDVAASDCDWSVDLASVAIGPDPNATPVPRVPVPQLAGEGWSRVYGAENSSYLTATQARQAILDAGLTVGECTEEGTQFVDPDRVWAQDPVPGTLLELGSPVNITIGANCDVVLGDRIVAE